MKLQCDMCEKEEAEVLCCADEAVLCKVCDSKVHTANKLSRKHHRLLLVKQINATSSFTFPPLSSHLPQCDTCKEKKAFVFCLEDRALLCKSCDVLTHAENPYSGTHQRFLISGIKVDLQSSSSECCNIHIGSSSSSSSNHHAGLPVTTIGPSYAETSAPLSRQVDEPALPTETKWSLHDPFCDTDDGFVFYDFSDVASSGFNDR